jgi:hypothetical protein
VIERLRELEPLTREYEQLRELAERLGVTYTPQASEPERSEAPTRRARAGRGKAKPSKRALAKAAGKPAPARKPAAKRSSKPRAATRASKPTTGRSRGAAARPGQRQQDVLRLVAEQPAITIRELGERLGVDATGFYRVIARLSDDGRVQKDGTRLYPAAAMPSADDATAAATGPAREGEPVAADAAQAPTSAADASSPGPSLPEAPPAPARQRRRPGPRAKQRPPGSARFAAGGETSATPRPSGSAQAPADRETPEGR